MIDENKIEEAAEKSLRDYVRKKKMEYEIVLLGSEDYFNIFKAGINWFLDNLWHDASEEAQKDKDLLVERIYNGEKSMATERANTLYDSWQTKVNREDITRWLYIDDLLKGGK